MRPLNPHNNHLIKSYEYQIELDDKKDAYQFQSDIISLQYSRINSLIEIVFNQFIPENYTYYIDSIELDLGVISNYNYETELPLRIEEELIKYFKSNMLENGSLRSAKKIELSISILNNLEYFLLHGHYSWQNNLDKSPSILLEELLKSDSIHLVTMLKKIGKKELIRKRMVYQFNEELLENMVIAVVGKENQYMISFKNNIFKKKEESKLIIGPSKNYKDAIWEIILAFIFEQTSDYYNKKSFLKYLIVHIAQKYQLTYLSLLQLIGHGIRLDKNKLSPSLEFARMIEELENQELASNKKDVLSSNYENVNWLEEIGDFISSGSFKSNIFSFSKSEFNHQLKILFHSKNKGFIKLVKKWFQNSIQLNRLLIYTDHHLSDELVAFCPSSFYKSIDHFILKIEKNKNQLTIETHKLWAKILNQKSKLILLSYMYSSRDQKNSIQNFLTSILIENKSEESVFHDLIKELQYILPQQLKRSLKSDLLNFNQLSADSKIRNILDEINTFTYQNEKELWALWTENNLSIWCKKLNCSERELMVQFEKTLSSISSNQSLKLILEWIRSKDLKAFQKQIYLEHNIPIDYRAKLALPTPYDPIFYIIDKGEIPWWLPSYSKSMMIESFTRIWESPEKRKNLLKTLAKSKNQHLFYSLIKSEQLYKLWKTTYRGQNEEVHTSLILLQNIFVSKFLPIGLLSHHDYNAFISNVSSIGLNHSGEKAISMIFNYLNNWMLNIEFLKYKNSSLYFYQFIDNLLNNISNTSLKKEFLKIKIILTGRIKKYINGSYKESNSMITSAYDLFKIESESVEKSDLIHIKKKISTKLNSEQEEFYSKSVSFIYAFEKTLTILEFKKIRNLFAEFVLLAYHSTGFNSWSKHQWNLITYYSFSQTIGIHKSKLLLLQNNPKIVLNPEIKLFQNQILEALIQENNISIHIDRAEQVSANNQHPPPIPKKK